MPRNIEDIRAELEAAEAEEHAKQTAIRDSVKPIRRYVIEPVKTSDWDRIYDDTIRAYKLSGTIINRAECIAVGRSDWELRDGAMRYLYNTVTHKIVSATGGGTIYSSNVRTMARISAFLEANPDGGDITSIMAKDKDAADWDG